MPRHAISKRAILRNVPKTCFAVVWSFVVGIFGGVIFGGPSGALAQSAKLEISIASDLPFPRTPFDPVIDFSQAIQDARLTGVLDLDSVQVINTATGQRVRFAFGDDFQYGDRGRLEWVVADPKHRDYQVVFSVVKERKPYRPQSSAPLVGVGDLLRYNGASSQSSLSPRPIALPYLSGLVDLTGDGKSDLVGCWNYAHRPGAPWDGVVCYPRVGDESEFRFGEMLRVRYSPAADTGEMRHLSSIYMNAEFVDLNRDGLVDLIYSPKQGDRIEIFLNSGRRPHPGTLPEFVAAGYVGRPPDAWEACRAIDLDRNGTLDLVVGHYFLRNRNPHGWPLELDEPVLLKLMRRSCYIDVDQDGLLDAVGLLEQKRPGPAWGSRVGWQRNLGDSLRFSDSAPLMDVSEEWCSDVAATGNKILVQTNVFQNVVCYEVRAASNNTPKLHRVGRAESEAAVMALSDQAWPNMCDWNQDGLLDLLVGGGYGWPRIVLNRGTPEGHAFDEAKKILADGRDVRVLMSYVYPGCHEYKHDMGYPYPALVDWDADGLPDLMLPNCSNRIFWYRNEGKLGQPRFGPQQQLNPVGFVDSPEKRQATGRVLMSRWEGELEPGQPFFWRTGAAFADFNGDGLTDVVTHDGETRKATLFAQFREVGADRVSRLALRKIGPLRLEDGRTIDDSIIGRTQHWTESFRVADWDADGRLDLIYSCAGSSTKASIYLLRNVGTKSEPLFAAPRTLCCYGEPIRVTAHGPHPAVGDFDGDGKPDLLTCVEWSVYPFFSHVALEMAERPKYSLRVQGSNSAGKKN